MLDKLTIILSASVGLISAASFDISVSNQAGDLTYTPSSVQAVQGDTVNFHFWPKNHTLTQSSFPQPCTPLDGGLDSGFRPVAAGTTDNLPVISYTVPQTSVPLWFYCRQQGPPIHCHKGMVFSINPPQSGNTFQKFQAAAIALGANDPPPATSTAAPPPTTTTAGTSASPPPPQVSTVTVTVTAGGSVYTTTYASWIGSPANPTPAAQPATHTVQVGPQGQLAFDPPQVVAAINDTVQFIFNPKAHSVTQSTFNNPCSLKEGGFDTGLMPTTADTSPLPVFEITINDTAPVWVYCQQQGPPAHCQKGMVFAVNAPINGPNNFTAFQQLALNSASNTTGSGSSGTNATGSGSSNGNNTATGGTGNGAPSSLVFSGLSILLGAGTVFTTLLL